MPFNLIIGNALSVVAAIFTIASSLSHGRKKIYLLQAIQCTILAVGSIFFVSYSGLATFVLCAARDCFTAYDKLTKKWCAVFLLATAVIGLLSNNRGILGLLPVAATLIYTLASYYVKKDFSIKVNITTNLALWCMYDIFILDIVSLSVDSVTIVATILSMIKDARREKMQEMQK